MKSVFQKIFINAVALFVVSYFSRGLTYQDRLQTLIVAAFVLALINAFVRPFLKILFLPINVITLGLFGWFLNVIILYLTTLLVPGFNVVPFSATLLGTTFVFNLFFAYIVVSFLINLVTTATSWLIG